MGWKLLDDFDACELELKAMALANTQASAKRAKERAQVPVKTGHLKESGYVEEPQAVEGHAATGLGYEAEYASQVHDGHMNQDGHFVAARPFLTNALNADEDNLADDVTRDLLKMGCTRVDRY